MKFDIGIVHPDDLKKIQDDYDNWNKYYINKYNIIKKCNPSVIVEIGVRAGYSAYTFMKACPKATYYGFDANKGTDSGADTLKYHDWALTLLEGYNINIDPSCDTQFRETLNVTCDFIHVDGSHYFDEVKHDLDLAIKTNPKFILVDDYTYDKTPEVRIAVDEWLSKRKYKTIVIDDFRGEMLIEL